MDDLIERIDTALGREAHFDELLALVEKSRRALSVARSMLVDIREVQISDAPNNFSDAWGLSIEWPNLAILADQLEEALK